MSRPKDDIIPIVEAGGGVMFNASGRPTEDLVHIVKCASSKTIIILRNMSGRSTQDLAHIAQNASGQVIFEL